MSTAQVAVAGLLIALGLMAGLSAVLIPTVLWGIEKAVGKRLGEIMLLFQKALNHGQSVDAAVTEIRSTAASALAKATQVEEDTGPLEPRLADVERRLDAMPNAPPADLSLRHRKRR